MYLCDKIKFVIVKKIASWFLAPTKKQAIILTLVWFAAVVMIIIASTDFFTRKLIQRNNFIPLLLIILTIPSISRIWVNYRKARFPVDNK
jgi:hypothetical protein